MTPVSGPEGLASRAAIDRSAFRGLPPTVRDSKGRVRHPALTDEFTQLPNRLHFDVVYRLLWEAGGRGIPVTMLLFEFAGFGAVSAEGQMRVGAKANGISRQMDMIARLDTDRVGVLLVDCNASGAMIAAERFQADLTPVLADLGLGFVGAIAQWKDWMTNPDDLLHAAEEALATARTSGRVEIHSS